MEKQQKLNLRVSEELKKEVQRRADELHMNVSEYIRHLIYKDLGK